MFEDKIVVYGNFMHSRPGYGGQITKTRSVFSCLTNRYGQERIIEFNMEKWKKHPISTVRNFKKILAMYKTIVILPGDNNLKFLLIFLKKYLREYNLQIHYMVVGGWLYDYLKNKKNKIDIISTFAGIYVETKELMYNLKSLGLKNVFYSPVFSLRKAKTKEDVLNDINDLKRQQNIRFCTFSRVLEEKGIGFAIEAVSRMNQNGINTCLDVYGIIDAKYKKKFLALVNDNQKFVRYCGFIPDDKVIETLSNYHFLLFATYYYGEGFPAALLEANMAGLPIIASDWKYNKEIVIDGKTGYLFEVKNADSLFNCINKAINNPDLMYKMRIDALESTLSFLPDKALEPLYNAIENQAKY